MFNNYHGEKPLNFLSNNKNFVEGVKSSWIILAILATIFWWIFTVGKAPAETVKNTEEIRILQMENARIQGDIKGITNRLDDIRDDIKIIKESVLK